MFYRNKIYLLNRKKAITKIFIVVTNLILQNYQVKTKFSRILITNFNTFDNKIKLLGIEVLSLLTVYNRALR